MACEYQKDIKFDEIEAGDALLIEYFSIEGAYLGDSRGTASYLFDDVWYFTDRGPLYRESGYRLFKVTDLSEPETTVTVAELKRLRGIEERMNRLADAYAANVVMLSGKAQSPDGLLGIMAECSLSAAKMIRKAIEGE